MARANRGYLPGLIWHITHRCHKKEFLLKFSRDRKKWLYWLFQAKKRFGLCIINYSLTYNHIHLLVFDDKRQNIIPAAMNLVAGRTAQEFNQRKDRRGAYWEDRYHATAIQSGYHLNRCMIYIDLNMIRAKVISHPKEWPFCGYNEILSSRQKYNLIDKYVLIKLLDLKYLETLKQFYAIRIDIEVEACTHKRESRWTESIAVGNKEFVEQIDERLSPRLRKRTITEKNEIFELHEDQNPYSDDFAPKTDLLSLRSVKIY